MAATPLTIKLRCSSWDQLAALYERDLKRGVLHLRAGEPAPAPGRPVQVDLCMPSGTVLVLQGQVGSAPRGRPGVELQLLPLPPSASWMIESALRAHRGQTGAAAPELADESETTAAEEALIAALSDELHGLQALNSFQILGIAYDAGDAEIHAAFAELSKKYHPDRFARYQNERVRALASDIFIVIKEAYTKAAPQSPPARPRRLSAEELFGDLDGMGGTGERPRAAVPLDVDEPTGAEEADRLLERGKLDEAAAAYEALVRARPTHRAARAGREVIGGLRDLAAGDRAAAGKHFDAALELDPLNERAARELAALRRGATEQRRGFLGKLLGRKR